VAGRHRHPSLELDDVVHQRARLGILAVLNAAEAAEFSYLKQLLELTDGNLKRHLDVLVEAGYVTAARSDSGRRRTTPTITDAGRAAFRNEIDGLRRLADRRQHGDDRVRHPVAGRLTLSSSSMPPARRVVSSRWVRAR
jgi:DNA-binding MarR family transcriptional regulator